MSQTATLTTRRHGLRRRATLPALLLVAAAVVTPTARAEVTIDGLAWLAGSWVRCDGERRSEEHWMPPAGGTMVGMNRSVAGDRTRGFEFLRIQLDDDGLVLLASPGGQAPTSFRWAAGARQAVTFANPEHDFPKRVRYQRDGDGLTATISGDIEGDDWRTVGRWNLSADGTCPDAGSR